ALLLECTPAPRTASTPPPGSAPVLPCAQCPCSPSRPVIRLRPFLPSHPILHPIPNTSGL
ncbi:hypothetical protein E4U54_006226, partial [Claviceps lovelessii]